LPRQLQRPELQFLSFFAFALSPTSDIRLQTSDMFAPQFPIDKINCVLDFDYWLFG
jgi:hypothetical protein